ncbi:unnamed protein product [Chrysodeixis includens]|uniref:Adenylate kinase 9-like n=1 Tax=Chrysodeixis includens TaxID=689277 RepID=A0A9N8PXN0_CHRIL|nr:unnamed protein product [Chrysodeixis includens]
MIKFENYKTNLDIDDKFDVKDVKVCNSVTFHRSTARLFKNKIKNEHTSPLLAAAIIGLDNTAIPITEKSKFMNIWTDHDAQEVFLNSKPTCYVLFGKYGAGPHKIGEALSKQLNCIHLCPETIINDELDQGSPTGRTLDFNMRHNISCTFEVLLKMLKIKVQSPAVQHRGFVISGFPLVTSSKNKLHFFESKYGEEGFLAVEELLLDMISNLNKKKSRKSGLSSNTSESSQSSIPGEEEEEIHTEEEAAEEEEEAAEPAKLPNFLLDSCSGVIIHKKGHFETKQATFLTQLEELFTLSLTPDIIIHVTCPDYDILTVRSNTYMNYKSGHNYMTLYDFTYVSDLRWPPKVVISDYEYPREAQNINPKYSCRLPSNFRDNCIDQTCNYQKMVFPFMHEKMRDFNPKMVIEVDGRANIHTMLHHLKERLILLQIQPVLIPEPLYLQDPATDIEEFWESVSEINNVTSDNVNFKRTPSHWFSRCPVELKLRRSIVGNPIYAMALFKHVYVMSSLDNFISFYINPRPYLQLKYLEPTCRIIIIGTKSSGKSMIAECLSWIFDCPIFSFNELLEKETENKYESFARSILSEIIGTIEDTRYREWQKSESDRVAKLNTWSIQILKLLNEYYQLVTSFNQKDKERQPVKKRIRIKKDDENEQLPEQEAREQIGVQQKQLPEQGKKEENEFTGVEKLPVLDPKDQMKFDTLRRKLSFLPILDNLKECETVLSDKNISKYAPAELSNVKLKPSIPNLGDEDVNIAISNYILVNDLTNEIKPTCDEIMSKIVKYINTIDANHEQETNANEFYGKYIIDGLPSDPEYWSHLQNPKLMPDHTIALIENKEVDHELIQYYEEVEKCAKYYADKILAADDPLIETKLISEKSMPNLAIIDIIKPLIDYCINKALDAANVSPNLIEDPDSAIKSFLESVDKFREDWDSLKLTLEEKSKSYIEVELDYKTETVIVEEVLSKLRNSYTFMPQASEDDDEEENMYDGTTKDLLTYNDPKFYCETYFYCPVTFYSRDTLWKGNPMFSFLYDNKVHNFADEELLEKFRTDKTRYLGYNKPFKVFPKIRVCITGSIGCGATTLGKKIAKELGLLYINFADIINFFMKPRHFQNVGRKYENIFTDESFVEDDVVKFQMGEEDDLIVSDILSNESEMRRMIQFYFDRGTPLLPPLSQKMVKKIWTDSFAPFGFVLDCYPRMPSDFEDMLTVFCIPDLVIDLESNSEVAVERMAPGMFKQWKSQQLEAKAKAKAKFKKEHEEWSNLITCKTVIKTIIEELFENVFFSSSDQAKRLSSESAKIDADPSGSSKVYPLVFDTYNQLIEEYLEPMNTNMWEKDDEALERIEARIQLLFETDDENIQAMNELIREQRIKMVAIDATKSAHKVFKDCLAEIMCLKKRCESLFEQTFIVDIDTANLLLEKGFCFISKFNRVCPVHIHEYPNSVQNTFKIARRKGTLFPIVHRSYVYFICKEAYVIKFRKNPLKYITSKAIEAYCEYPLRIGFIGAPKSGVSSLAAKIARDNCLICISKGTAIRSVLEDMPWTELAFQLRKQLGDGKVLDDDVVVEALQSLAIDHRTVTYGFVYDGIPDTPYRAKALVKHGLYPNIVFDLNATENKIVTNALNEVYYDVIKYRPTFPKPLIEKRYENWKLRRFKIREWIADDYQNLTVINANQSKWKVFKDVNNCLLEVAAKIHFYLARVGKTVVRAMWVSNETFAERQSLYRNLCPVCFNKRVYRHSDYPPDKKGVVEYKSTYYWICEEHLDTVMMFPHVHLAPQDIEVPELAAVVKTINKQYLYEKGTCIVTYAENLPAQKVVAGCLDYACRYRQKAYLFCSQECLTKFLARPQVYYDIKVFRESKNFKTLSLKNLPHLGYLEQTIGKILTDACCAVNVFRPKYPGLTFQSSALIFIALYLKVNDPLIDEKKKALHRKVFKVFEARCKMLTRAGLILRSMNNPFASYPKCYHAKPTLRPIQQEELSSATLERPAPSRISSYVQMYKPSFLKALHPQRPSVAGAMVRQ